MIDAIAQQWLWRFEYPGGTPGHRTFTYGELVVPVDTPVILDITSTDVLHSWWVPALGGQVQATPGDTVADLVQGRRGRPLRAAARRSSPAPASRRCGAWVRVVTRARVHGLRRAADEGPDRGAGVSSTDCSSGPTRPGPRRPANERPAADTATTARPEVVTRDLREPRQAWIERATSADHKTVGLLFIATALSLLALAATEFALMRMQLIIPENSLIQPEIFNRLMTALGGHLRRPRLHPAGARADQLHRPASDRRPRGRPAAPAPALLLALPRRRADRLRQLPLHARRRPARPRCRRSPTSSSRPRTAPTPGSPAPRSPASGSSAGRST